MRIRHVKDGVRVTLPISRDLYGAIEEFAASNNMSPELAITMILQYYLGDDRAVAVLEQLANYFKTANRNFLASRVRSFLQDLDNELAQSFSSITVETAPPDLQQILLQLIKNPWIDDQTVQHMDVPVVEPQTWLSPEDTKYEDDENGN